MLRAILLLLFACSSLLTACGKTGHPTTVQPITEESLSVYAAVTETPPISIISPTATSTPGPSLTYYVTHYANARACSNLDCKVVASFTKDTAIKIVGTAPGNASQEVSFWYQITWEDRILYIPNDDLQHSPSLMCKR